tara:strand:+ start:884 stop:2353 length:1470 start_codon:yes stop_codon:yes gene_type:complete
MSLRNDAEYEHEKTTTLYPLLEGERLISIVHHPLSPAAAPPSSIEQMMRLTHSDRSRDIGKNGPALASLALDPKETNEHLRLYEAVFGRDSLRVAGYLVERYPELAKQTVLRLAELQGVTYSTEREEEPGRIVHEARTDSDPQAKRLTQERGWQWPYYGAVDTNAEFIRTLYSYTIKTEDSSFLSHTYTDRRGETHSISHALRSALDWIARKRLSNPEGLIEFKSVLPMGIENQVWKDSWDAYHHADGTLANHAQGIASLEVQVASYDALLDAASLYESYLDDPVYSAALHSQAEELRQSIVHHFWTEDKGGYFVLGTDRDNAGNLRQLKIRTSNMGHALNSRLLEGQDPESVRMRTATIAHITSPELRCASGIRTLASDEIRFRPGAYHNGSVWLWDTHYIAKGLRRHGKATVADSIDQALITVSNKTGMFPEYVRGEQERIALNEDSVRIWDEAAQRENLIEQPPQEVQAWTVAAILESKTLRTQRS